MNDDTEVEETAAEVHCCSCEAGLTREDIIRLEALRLAHWQEAHPETCVQRAKVYAAYLGASE